MNMTIVTKQSLYCVQAGMLYLSLRYEQVRVQLPTSADNMTLLAFAPDRHATSRGTAADHGRKAAAPAADASCRLQTCSVPECNSGTLHQKRLYKRQRPFFVGITGDDADEAITTWRIRL